MRIEKNCQAATHIDKPSQASSPAARPTAVSLDESHRLNQAMTATPQVRSAEVARARALLADPQFPSPQSLEKVASLFAKHLSVETAAK